MFVFNDGGRASAGFKGEARDCVTRAISIAAQMPYLEVYDLVNQNLKTGSARTGVPKPVTRKVLADLGWRWVPTMKIGQGCKVHLKADELPAGRIICQVSAHVVAVIDGVIYDTHDSSRDGSRCVYGYWIKEQ